MATSRLCSRRRADRRATSTPIGRAGDLTEADWRAAEGLLRDTLGALEPLRALPPRAPLEAFLQAHRAALTALAAADAADALAEAPGGETLIALMDEWADAAREEFFCERPDYVALFDAVAAEQRAPDAATGHPRLRMLGLLELRLLSFDLTLLAGLDETVWPPQARTDSFSQPFDARRARPVGAGAADRPDRA